MKIKVRLKKREVELKEHPKNIKIKIEVKEQDYVVVFPENWEYEVDFLDNDVYVECEYEDGTIKEELWWVAVKKGYFTNDLFS